MARRWQAFLTTSGTTAWVYSAAATTHTGPFATDIPLMGGFGDFFSGNERQRRRLFGQRRQQAAGRKREQCRVLDLGHRLSPPLESSLTTHVIDLSGATPSER
ncbi:MAG: hypothetical protein QM756_18865 [Polyangiaceae bacterium]